MSDETTQEQVAPEAQAAPISEPQTSDAGEAQGTIPAATVETPEALAGGESEARAPRFGSLDDIRSALDAEPELQRYIEQTRADAINEARQQQLNELKRQAADSDRVRKFESRLLDRLGIDPEAIDRGDRRELSFIHDAVSDVLTAEYGRAWTRAAAESLGLSGDDAEALIAQIDGEAEPEKLSGMAARLIQRAVQHNVSSGIGGLTLKDLPADAPLHKEIDARVEAEVARRVAAELQAREVEAKPKPDVPERLPGAAPAGMSRPSWLNDVTGPDGLPTDEAINAAKQGRLVVPR